MSQPKTTTMYRIGGGHSKPIARVQVVKITPKTITVMESFCGSPARPERHNLRNWPEYFSTFEEAKAELVTRRKIGLESAHEQVRRAEQQLAEAELLQNPSAEFCLACGAGIEKHRREGEGTCSQCDLHVTPSVEVKP